MRIIEQGKDVLVLDTEDAMEACKAIGISPASHKWTCTDFGYFVRRSGKWRGRSDYPPLPKDIRKGVMFVGPIINRETNEKWSNT